MGMEKYERIRELREDADLTQVQVGEAINVPQRTYAYYESGQRMMPPPVLCALADFYSVSVDYMLGRTDNKKDEQGIRRSRRRVKKGRAEGTVLPWQGNRLFVRIFR